MSRKKNIFGVVRFILLAVILFIMIFPIYYLIVTSLKSESAILETPVKYFVTHPLFSNYSNAWRESKFARYFFNTAMISVGVLLLVAFVSLLTGYALSRYTFLGKRIVTIILFVSQMIPTAVIIIPMFTLMKSMGLVNSLCSVVLATSSTLIAYCAILMKGFYSNISIALEEAAWIDGCSRLQGLIYVVLPLLAPGLVATGAYAFVNAWNGFLFPLILLTDPDKFTITIGLKSLIGQYTVNYGRLSAAGVICLIPTGIAFIYIQKYLVSGLSAGAVKG